MAHGLEGFAGSFEGHPRAAQAGEEKHGNEGEHDDLLVGLGHDTHNQAEAGRPEGGKHNHEQCAQRNPEIVHAKGKLTKDDEDDELDQNDEEHGQEVTEDDLQPGGGRGQEAAERTRLTLQDDDLGSTHDACHGKLDHDASRGMGIRVGLGALFVLPGRQDS
jgi:hypothetical protein